MTIKLRRGKDVWLADKVGDPEAKRLFGTTELPTPFRVSTPAEEVKAEIEQLNPNDNVVLVI